MRRLVLGVLLGAVVTLSGCRRHEIIHPEPTEEGSVSLMSVVSPAMGASSASNKPFAARFQNSNKHK